MQISIYYITVYVVGMFWWFYSAGSYAVVRRGINIKISMEYNHML